MRQSLLLELLVGLDLAMSDLPASIWKRLPRERRGRIVIVLVQMALHRMREAAVAGEAPDEGGEPCPAPQRPDLRQDPSTPPGPSGDRVRPPIHGSAG